MLLIYKKNDSNGLFVHYMFHSCKIITNIRNWYNFFSLCRNYSITSVDLTDSGCYVAQTYNMNDSNNIFSYSYYSYNLFMGVTLLHALVAQMALNHVQVLALRKKEEEEAFIAKTIYNKLDEYKLDSTLLLIFSGELAERIWCLYIFHVCGSHPLHGAGSA